MYGEDIHEQREIEIMMMNNNNGDNQDYFCENCGENKLNGCDCEELFTKKEQIELIETYLDDSYDRERDFKLDREIDEKAEVRAGLMMKYDEVEIEK